MSEIEKGQARAAGRSVHDVLATDAVPAPPPLLASAYDFWVILISMRSVIPIQVLPPRK